MSKKSLIILWIIALGFICAIISVQLSQPENPIVPTDRQPGDSVFESFKAEDISTVAITTADGTVTLSKTDGAWTVKERADYPADTQSVNSVLRALLETKIIQAVRAGSTYDKRFGFSEPDGLSIDFENESGKMLHSIAIGKTTNEESSRRANTSRFVRTSETPDDVYIVDGSFASFTPNPADWLADDFFRIERMRRIETADWTLIRTNENSDFTSLDGLTLKADAAAPVNSLFAFNRFTDVAIDPEEIASGEKKTVKIDTFDSFSYKITYQAIKDDPANYLLTVTIDAVINENRIAPEGETAEQKAAVEPAFQARIKSLKDKLQSEKIFEGVTYKVPQSMVAPLLKTQDELLTTASASSTPQQPQAPRTAVTPPIRIPAQGE